MALVPDNALAPLPPKLDDAPLPGSVRRMLQLAGPTLQAVDAGATQEPITLYLGLPSAVPNELPWRERFLRDLALAAGREFNFAESRLFHTGRSATIAATQAALAALTEEPAATIIVGGVDTYLDLRRIADLDAEGRILGPNVTDGFIPGEGAAFLVLKGSRDDDAQVTVHAASSCVDPGHRYGGQPALGEGLSSALTQLRNGLNSEPAVVGTTWAGFTGENFDAKLWGVARLRHSEFFSTEMIMQHPADSIGDTGAAAGAILAVLADCGLRTRSRPGLALLWAASDVGDCGGALFGRTAD